MPELCRAGAPDDRGRGGCRGWDGRFPSELWSAALLCGLCLVPAERDVRALVLDYRDLEQRLPPSLGQWGDGMPRGKSSPLPLSEPVLTLQQDIHWLVSAWDDVVRDVARLSEKPTRVRDGFAVQQSVAILAPRLDVLAAVPAVAMWTYLGAEGSTDVPGWQGVLDLVALHQRARTLLGLTAAKKEHCSGIPCRNPECDLKLLYRIPGTDEVRCDACGMWYDAHAYQSWVSLVSAAAKRDQAA